MQNILNHINNYSKKSWIQFLLFSGIIWLIFVHLHINRHLEDIIIGPHYWRKSDTYSQVMNYYYNGLNFFDHSYYYNLFDSNGKAVGEFPLFYYLIALQLKLFGNYSLILKLNWLIVSMIGLFALFKICYHFLKHFWLSVFASTLFFLSPIFSYYFISYLPDPIALSFMMMGLLFLIKKTNRLYVILALFFIGVSGMIKPFFLVPYVAFLLTILVNRFYLKKPSVFKFKLYYIIPFVMVASWFFYASWYNNLMGCDCFLASPRPIWNESYETIVRIFAVIFDHGEEYINLNVLWVFVLAMLINLVWWKKTDSHLNVFYLFSIIGSLMFVALFFSMLEHHDYYIFPVLFLLPLTFGLLLYKIKRNLQLGNWNYLVATSLLLFTYINLNHSWNSNEHWRKAGWKSSKHEFVDYQNLEFFLTKNHVNSDDLVFTFSDKSPSYALSLLNRQGWSGYQTHYKKYQMQRILDDGANFLIINSVVTMNAKDSVLIEPYLNYPIDDTNHIFIYDLKPYH